MQDFNSLFPHFLERCVELKSALVPVAYLLLVVGVISSTLTGRRSASAYLRTFGRTIVYILLLVYLVTWGNELTALTDRAVKEIIRADPAAVFEQYNAALIAEKSQEEEAGWWDKLFNAGTTIFEAIVSGFLWLFGLFASLIQFLAYIVQKMVLYLGYSLSPIFIGFMAIQSLSSIGHKYLLGLIGVMIWPLGWAVAAIVSDGLLRFMTDQSFLQGNSVTGAFNYGLQDFIGLALLGVWLIFSTIAAPILIQRVVAEGYQIGSALLSGAMSGGFTGTGAAASTVANLGNRPGNGLVSAGLSVGAGAAAGLGSLASAAIGDHSNSIIGTLAYQNDRQSARKGSLNNESGADDISGEHAAREMIERTRSST